jgi:hypothetical protein
VPARGRRDTRSITASGHERARRVVHEHDATLLGHVLEPVGDALGALAAAVDTSSRSTSHWKSHGGGSAACDRGSTTTTVCTSARAMNA